MRRSIRCLSRATRNWELCIADDCSTEPHVRTILSEYAERDARITRHLSRQVTGTFRKRQIRLWHSLPASGSRCSITTMYCIHMALHFVAEAIAANPSASLIYSDEDKIDQYNERYSPYFKCDYNYELLLAHNMICHLGVYRRSLIEEVGGFGPGFEGAQDYDLALRVIERIGSDQVVHLPRVLYHWRAHRGSTAATADAKPYAAEAARRAVAEHLQRRGVRANGTCRRPRRRA